MTLDVNQARQQFSTLLPPALAKGGKAGPNEGVTFAPSKTDGWGAALRFLAKITVLPWAIAKAVGATERRVLMQSSEGRIDTGVTKNEFKKLSASPKGAEGQRSQAQDRQVRSIATKLIKAGGETAQLNQVLKGCSTDDLVALGRDCANDPTGEFRQQLFAHLRGQLAELNQAARGPDMVEKTARYRRNQTELDARIAMQQVSPAPVATQIADMKAAVRGAFADKKMVLAKNFFEKTLKADPGALLDLPELASRLLSNQHLDEAQRGAHVSQVCAEMKDAVVLLVTFPELGQIFGLTRGLGEALQSSMKLDPAKALGTEFYSQLRSALVGGLLDQLKDSGLQGLPSREALGLADPGGPGKKSGLALAAGLLSSGKWAMALAPVGSHLTKPEVAKAVNAEMDQFVEGFKFGEMMAPIKNMNLEFQGEFRSFVDEVLGGYFDAQAPQDKRSMLAAMYRMPPDANARLAGVLRGSGPYLQKMLQQFGDKATDPQLRLVLDQLKTGLDPIDDTERRALLADILQQPGMDGAKLLEVRSVSAASVAEAVACKIQKPGDTEPREYIIKLLRPGIEQRAGRERQYFENVARKYGGVQGTFETVADQIEGELDLRLEAAQVARGAVYSAAGRAGIQAMRLADGFAPEKNVLIIEKAPGQTVKSYLDSTRRSDLAMGDRLALINQGRALSSQLAQLSGIWLKEAALGTGFYHGDLHAGNMLTDPEAGLTVIDFGNAGQIDAKSQSHFLLFTVALEKNKPALVMQALRDLLPPKDREALSAVAPQIQAQIMALMVKDSDGRLAQALPFAVVDAINKRGISMPPVFVNLCRAQDMLVQAHKGVVSRVKDLIDDCVDPKPQGCDEDEMEGQMRQAITGRLADTVGKLGWGKAWQLASTTTLDQLESEMLKLPGVRQTMDNYHQSYQQFQRDLDAHSARVQDFEDSDPWVTASAALGSATREAKTALVDRYIKDYPKFDSVDESRRAVLSRCFDPTSVISASDWQLVQPLLDDIAPLLILKVKSAEATLAQVQATRPAEPVEPKPVYIEEVYLSALAQAPSDAPPAVLGLPVQPQAVLPPHMEAVAQMA